MDPADADLASWDPQRVDEDTWLLVRPGTRRRVRRLGSPETVASIVYNPRSARKRPGRFEIAVSDFLAGQHAAWLLRELDVDVVLDVGANTGQYARNLRRNGFKGRIVSFEPVPELVARLEEVSAEDPHWRIVGCALGDTDGTAEIHLNAGTLSSLLPSSDFGREWSEGLRAPTTTEIRVRRLDDLWDDVLEELDVPRPFLKLDTQGYDLATFRGAGDRVQHLVGLQSEVAMVPIYDGMPRLVEQLTAYEAAGFETTGMFPISRDRDTLRAIEFDLMMVGPAFAR